ncbi:hypothetical protein BDV3_006448 [Batrachochytrium dendrobatidis]|nr:Histone-lysine N-methyltransferase set-6 [Batrachochytrium dendrobatidis]
MESDYIILKSLPNNRFFEAASNISSDTLIFACTPYAFATTDSYRKRVCAYCMTCVVDGSSGFHFRCKQCDQVFACSQKCLDMLAQNGHDRICSAMRKLATFKASVHEKSILKLVLIVCLNRLVKDQSQTLNTKPDSTSLASNSLRTVEKSEIHEQNQSLVNSMQCLSIEPETVDQSEMANPNPSSIDSFPLPAPPTFLDFLNLQSHYSSWQFETHNEWKKSMTFLFKLLTDSNIVPCQDIDIQTVRDCLFHIISRIESNCFGIWKPNGKEACMGRAVFPAASYFNHSCFPNCQSIKHDHKMAFRTLKDVSKGEMLTISYIDTNMPVSARRARLMDDYFFECMCERCISESGMVSNASQLKVSYTFKKYEHKKRTKKKSKNKNDSKKVVQDLLDGCEPTESNSAL